MITQFKFNFTRFSLNSNSTSDYDYTNRILLLRRGTYRDKGAHSVDILVGIDYLSGGRDNLCPES